MSDTIQDVGFVEVLSPRRVTGWAWDPDFPNKSVVVEVYYNGKLERSVSADMFRPDLQASGLGDGRHGFEINFTPGAISSNGEIFLKVSGGGNLAIAPTAANWTSYEGAVEVSNTEGDVRGWVWDVDNPRLAVQLEFRQHDKLIGTATANLFREDLHAGGIGDGRHSFFFQADRATYSATAEVDVFISGTDVKISRLLAAARNPLFNETFTAKDYEDRSIKDIDTLPYLADENESKITSGEETDFDIEFYILRFSSDPDRLFDAKQHYKSAGWKEGRSPVPWFSTIDYLSENEDVLLSGLEPFAHYLAEGMRENRRIIDARPIDRERQFRADLLELRTIFDEAHYKRANPDLDLSHVRPELHYILHGWKTSRSPVAWFSPHYYLSAYPDIKDAGIEPFLHYVRFGRAEGRQPNSKLRDTISGSFDATFYIGQAPELFGQEPLEHFIAFGWRSGLNPNAWFDTNYYLRMSPDVAEAGLHPLFHYETSGRTEGRPCSPQNLRKMPEDTSLPTILFVGHDAIRSGGEVVLLEILRWIGDHTRYPIKLILLGLGDLIGDYAAYADVYVTNHEPWSIVSAPRLIEFLNDSFAFTYVNTVAAGSFADVWRAFPGLSSRPLILHVHELWNVIREHQEQFDNIIAAKPSCVAVSKEVAATLSKLGVSEDNIFLSNPFINIGEVGVGELRAGREAARTALRLNRESFVVLGCGTVYHRKGPDIFIAAALSFFRREPLSDVVFVWIGSGADLEACQSQVLTLDQSDKIRFVGFSPDAARLVAAADVFCLSSREDPFPLVCLEAARYAIPSVYFADAGGIGEFLGADAGIPVRGFKPETMGAAIRSYFKNGRLLEAHGLKARARLLEGYTAERRILEIWMHCRRVSELSPSVSALVLGYNHGEFLHERISSVIGQSLKDIEIFLMDDCSSDNSHAVMKLYQEDPRVRIVRNETNSGGAFHQWKKAILYSNSDLVWVAEGDDFITSNFLAEVVPAFSNPMLSVAFCETEIVNEAGEHQPNALNAYYRLSDFAFEKETVHVDGRTAADLGFASMCLIVNASSAIMRKSNVLASLDEAASFRMCGDWYVYLSALRRGALFYTRRATNFFRRHTASAVNSFEGTPEYFDERTRIAEFVESTFPVSRRTAKIMQAQLDYEWYRFRDRLPKRRRDGLYHAPPLARTGQGGERLRIGFYVHGMLFSTGGIERLAAELSNELSWRGHEVFIFCREWGGNPVYPLLNSVQVNPIFNEENLAKSIPELRCEIARCDLDVFVPMLSEWLFEPIIEAAAGLGIKIVVSEHNDPWQIESRWWNRERRLEYFAQADAIHLLLHKFMDSLPAAIKGRAKVIPNGVNLIKENSDTIERSRPFRIIGIGRLARQKRFDRLIKAFAAIAKLEPDWRLDIFGEGVERGILQELIAELGVERQVMLRGVVPNVIPELEQSSIFVIPSEFEGFGIVVIEAQLAGLPCVGYVDCNGPNELILHRMNGLLADHDENGENLSVCLQTLINDQYLRAKMGAHGKLHAADFSLEKVASEWELFLREVCR